MTIKKKKVFKTSHKKNCKLYLKSMYIMHISDSNSDFYYLVSSNKKEKKRKKKQTTIFFLIF